MTASYSEHAAHIAIVGSRRFQATGDYIDLIFEQYVSALNVPLPPVIVSGGAANVDAAAEAEASRRGLGVLSYRPRRVGAVYCVERFVDGESTGMVEQPKIRRPYEFDTFSAAAKQRNWWIARDAPAGFHALWDGLSGGTAHAIAAAYRLGRQPRIWMESDS